MTNDNKMELKLIIVGFISYLIASIIAFFLFCFLYSFNISDLGISLKGELIFIGLAVPSLAVTSKDS